MDNRWRRLLCAVLSLSAIIPEPAGAGSQVLPPPAVVPLEVYLTASGKDGSAVMLTQSELSVSVDKQPAQVTALHPAKNDKLLFAVLVDISGSNAPQAAPIRKAAVQLFESLSTGGNQGYLVLFNDLVAASTEPVQASRVAATLNNARFADGTALNNAIEEVCTKKLSRLGNPGSPRRAILLISDGEDDASILTGKRAEEAAEKEGVAIFSLVTGPSKRGTQFLREAGQVTGGRAIVPKDIADGVAPLLSALEQQWSLSFLPVQSPDQKFHVLSIKSSQADVQISVPARIFLH